MAKLTDEEENDIMHVGTIKNAAHSQKPFNMNHLLRLQEGSERIIKMHGEDFFSAHPRNNF